MDFEGIPTHTHTHTQTHPPVVISLAFPIKPIITSRVCVSVYRNEKAGTFRSVFGFSHFQKMEFHYYFMIAIDLSFLKLKKTKNDEFETFTFAQSPD
jgi:hypothetical protein